MREDDDEIDDAKLSESVRPLVEWMIENRVDHIHLVAKRIEQRDPPTSPLRDESDTSFSCEGAPHAFGLRDVYAVSDEHGRGRLNGPSRVPQDVLRPVLRALDEARVSELVIDSSSSDASARPTSSRTQTTTLGEFEEGEDPLEQGYWPVFITVQVADG